MGIHRPTARIGNSLASTSGLFSVETVSRLPKRAFHEPRTRFFEPASGVVILVIDNLFFGTDLLTGWVDLVPSVLLAFLLSFFAVYGIQRKKAGDTRLRAGTKAAIAAILTGMPTSIGGTVLGAWILWASGLRAQ